ncbi:MAG: acetyl-CoA sensor PanZ family protein, partial [Pseudomonadales bacterium]|nr:acetyl-CoA sensor PanZ family protein [Pseudomonadales bacterium]
MPLMVHRFDAYPAELEDDLTRIYVDAPKFKGLGDQALTTIRDYFILPNTCLYAAQFNGRWLAASIVTGEKEREIRLICVRNMSRQQGIGRKLLSEIKRLELVQGCEALYTRVESGNPAAQAFLTSLDIQVNTEKEKDNGHYYSLLSVNFAS